MLAPQLLTALVTPFDRLVYLSSGMRVRRERPWGRTGSGWSFHPLLGVLLLELRGAEIAERRSVTPIQRQEAAGVRERFGAFGKNVATGLALRHDLGSQYLSHHFQAEIRFLGIASSPAFVREPEGNGCAERFIRVLKENLLL